MRVIRQFPEQRMTATQAGESVRQWRASNALRSSLFSALLLLTVSSSPNGASHRASAAQSSDLAANEKDECTKNLKLISDAIEAYRKDHKDLPHCLSALTSKHHTPQLQSP